MRVIYDGPKMSRKDRRQTRRAEKSREKQNILEQGPIAIGGPIGREQTHRVATSGRYNSTPREYFDGGYIPPDSPMTKDDMIRQAKFENDMYRFHEGVAGTLGKELRQRDRAVRRSGPDAEGYYPAYEQEVSVLLDMLNNGDLQFDDMVRKGKRRRGFKQGAALLGQLGLGGFLAGKVNQAELERAGHGRVPFFQALLHALRVNK